MVKIVTVYPKDDGESYLMDVSVDQFTEIVKHIGEGPTRANTTPSPKIDDQSTIRRSFIRYIRNRSRGRNC